MAPAWRRGNDRGVNLIRYADDFVVTAPSREVLEAYVLPKVAAFLAARGLALSAAKTRIVHVDDGFHFLGFEVRRGRGTLLARPEKAKVVAHLQRINAYLRTHKQAPVGQVIRELGPVIRGWAAYYRHCTASKTFAYVSHRVWAMLWAWAKRRHPNKSRQWVRDRYVANDGYWTFADGAAQPARQCHADHPFHQGDGALVPHGPNATGLLGASHAAATCVGRSETETRRLRLEPYEG